MISMIGIVFQENNSSDLEQDHILEKHGGLLSILKQLYPNHDWDSKKFISRYKRSVQRWVGIILREIFPQCMV